MVPMLVICLLKSNVRGPVTAPRLRLADSTPAAIVAPMISVFTTIEAVLAGSSVNEIIAALAGVVPREQTPINASGMNNRFAFMDWLLHLSRHSRTSELNCNKLITALIHLNVIKLILDGCRGKIAASYPVISRSRRRHRNHCSG